MNSVRKAKTRICMAGRCDWNLPEQAVVFILVWAGWQENEQAFAGTVGRR